MVQAINPTTVDMEWKVNKKGVNEVEQQYYLLSLKWSNGTEYFVWWGPNCSGYTSNIDKAGIYSQSEIDSRPVYFSNTGVMPVPVESVEKAFKLTVIPTLVKNYEEFEINKHLETAVEY